MKRGRRPQPCSDPQKLRELVASGATMVEVLEAFGSSSRKQITRWLDEHGLEIKIEIPDLPGEEWRPVVGWEGEYEVSNQGRVKTVPHIGYGGKSIQAKLRTPTFMSGRNAYWQCHLMRGGRGTKVYRANIHVLVLEAFVGPRPEGMEVRHLNGNGFDNRLENLRWDTHKANMADNMQYDRPHRTCKTCNQPLYADLG